MNCSICNGTGKTKSTRTELDTGMSIALGTALGMGLFPSYKTVEEESNCTYCGGTGKR